MEPLADVALTTPSTRMLISVTAVLSVALAEIMTVPVTDAPVPGPVIATTGGVMSLVVVVGADAGVGVGVGAMVPEDASRTVRLL